MPATSIDCTVIDADLQQPIVYALLYMVYEGPNGDKVMEGPFLTDENGHGRIDVKKRSIWMKGTDAFFAGGYLRHIEVKVTGYKDSGYWENFNFCLLEKKAPFTFKLKHE